MFFLQKSPFQDFSGPDSNGDEMTDNDHTIEEEIKDSRFKSNPSNYMGYKIENSTSVEEIAKNELLSDEEDLLEDL